MVAAAAYEVYISCKMYIYHCLQASSEDNLITLCTVDSRLSCSGVPSRDFYCNFCSACSVTVVIFGHLNSSFYLLSYSCEILEMPASEVAVFSRILKF